MAAAGGAEPAVEYLLGLVTNEFECEQDSQLHCFHLVVDFVVDLVKVANEA